MEFELQKLTLWKRKEDNTRCMVGAMSPMMAVRETWDRIKPAGSEVIVTAIYRLWHADNEVHTFWEPGNTSPVSVDILIAVLNFAGFMIIADFGHKIMAIALKLSEDEPLVLSDSYKQYPWIKSIGVSDFEQALARIDLEALRVQCINQVEKAGIAKMP